MAKLSQADQFYAATGRDIELQKTLIKYADELEEWYRTEVWNTYNDQQLQNEYKALRTFNSINNSSKTDKNTMKEIVRIPAGAVYQFLNDIFDPIYGPKWMREKKVLYHELVRPWWVVERI